ncbi:hypothetical protein EGW08_000662 [Elysia chlorotica]|uniref:Phosphoglycerate kinase n=1 Tax=Elysia chlorotica TaxID=188477 RepID=A0A433UCE4_ELYCH|nr:hypothetical protein EGW08_000662 [Elysia chlorotica]
METGHTFRRPRAISCPGTTMPGQPGYRSSPWIQSNSYFRACFENDLGAQDEDSDLDDMVAGVKGNDYSMSTLRAADDDDEDNNVPSHSRCDIGAEDADSRRIWSSTDDNVNRHFDDDSSGRREDHMDESRIEQDYLEDFESTASGSESVTSLESSTHWRRGGPQGMDEETNEANEMNDDIKGEDESESDEEKGHELMAEKIKSGLMELDPVMPDEYLEEGMQGGDSKNIQSKLTISKCRLKDRRVLIRTDFNVPVENDQVMNTDKLVSALPTILYALNRGAKSVVLMSHMGRPEGQFVPALSLAPVAAELESLLGGRTVTFLEDCVGDFVESVCADPEPGSVILLENLRFHPEEEGKGVNEDGEKVRATPEDIETFRESLRKLGDVYVNDAFGTSNRAHSSIVGVELPLRVAGLQLKKEVDRFSKAIDNPALPYLAIVGGGKLSDKVDLIESLLDSVTDMIITGDVAFTFMKVMDDMEIGDSPFDDTMSEFILEIHQKATRAKVKLHFPVDFVAADPSNKDAPPELVDEDTGIPEGKVGVDIGEKSRELFADLISRAKTIAWCGPPGAWDSETFYQGSEAMADAINEVTGRGEAMVILGDRETVNCAQKFELDMATLLWGGASLDMLEKKVLPGVANLTDLPKIKSSINVRPMRTCPLANKKVGIRLDLDVPVERNEDGELFIPDQGIIKLTSVSQTIRKALKMGARSVVLFSHRGNPEGKRDPELSMEPIVQALERIMERPVIFIADSVCEETLSLCEDPWPGSVFLLENLRFYPEEQGYTPRKKTMVVASQIMDVEMEEGEAEEAIELAHGESKGDAAVASKQESTFDVNVEEEDTEMDAHEGAVDAPDIEFARQVAVFRNHFSRMIDVYVLDDFNTIDLPHSSVVGVKAPVMVCGPLVENELNIIAGSLQTPDRPLVAILGGNKIQEKFELIPGLLDIVDDIIIGGALAFPFLAALYNMPIGSSPTDKAIEEKVPMVMAAAAANDVTIHLPKDFVVANSLQTEVDVSFANREEGISEGKIAYDIGEESRAYFIEVIGNAKTIVMSGPIGDVEEKVFQGGTDAILNAISEATEDKAFTVLAGETLLAYANSRREDLTVPIVSHMTSVAAVKLLAGMTLPGLAVLDSGYKPKQEPKKRRRKKKKKKKKKPKLVEEKPVLDRRARIAAWIENTKNWKYTPPPIRKLPPLPAYPRPATRIKYTGVRASRLVGT